MAAILDPQRPRTRRPKVGAGICYRINTSAVGPLPPHLPALNSPAGGGIVPDASTNDHERTFIFKFPSNFVLGTNLAKPILAFWVTPMQQSRFNFSVNHQKVFTLNMAPSTVCNLFTPFLFPQRANIPDDVPVRLFVESGRLDFANIVMWYQVRIG